MTVCTFRHLSPLSQEWRWKWPLQMLEARYPALTLSNDRVLSVLDAVHLFIKLCHNWNSVVVVVVGDCIVQTFALTTEIIISGENKWSVSTTLMTSPQDLLLVRHGLTQHKNSWWISFHFQKAWPDQHSKHWLHTGLIVWWVCCSICLCRHVYELSGVCVCYVDHLQLSSLVCRPSPWGQGYQLKQKWIGSLYQVANISAVVQFACLSICVMAHLQTSKELESLWWFSACISEWHSTSNH